MRQQLLESRQVLAQLREDENNRKVQLENTQFFIYAYIVMFIGLMFTVATSCRVIGGGATREPSQVGVDEIVTSSIHLSVAISLVCFVEFVTITGFCCNQKHGVSSN